MSSIGKLAAKQIQGMQSGQAKIVSGFGKKSAAFKVPKSSLKKRKNVKLY